MNHAFFISNNPLTTHPYSRPVYTNFRQIYSDYGADYDLPDFFALVGIDNGFGKKVLSELTLGWYFEFQDGVLTTCDSISGNETDYDPIEKILNTSLLPPL